MSARQRSIALINDLSGFGRCSLTVSLPIISALKVQCAVLPTCVLSNHTAYDSFYMKDLTDSMDPWMDEWKKLDLHFDGIYTGFLGSEEQIEKVLRFMDLFARNSEDTEKKTVVIVDPVMGDNGVIYGTYTEGMCRGMKELVRKANVITPNLTEACLLADWPYREDFLEEELEKLGRILMDMGPDRVVISGIRFQNDVCDLMMEKGRPVEWNRARKIFEFRHGTGDVFASIVAADAVKGIDFYESVRKAAKFVRDAIRVTQNLHVPMRDGVAFEEILYTLR